MFGHLGDRDRIGYLAVGGLVLLGMAYIGTLRLHEPGPVVIQTAPPASVRSTGRRAARRTAPDALVGVRQGSGANDSGDSAAKSVKKKSRPSIIVHVTGAVQQPGLISVPAGSDVLTALIVAGIAKDADPRLPNINIWARLKDGEIVYIPHRGENAEELKDRTGIIEDSPPAKLPPPQVSINDATEDELAEVKGIGAATAARIVDYREEHGPFMSLEQLYSVPGIGEAKANKLMELLRL